MTATTIAKKAVACKTPALIKSAPAADLRQQLLATMEHLRGLLEALPGAHVAKTEDELGQMSVPALLTLQNDLIAYYSFCSLYAEQSLTKARAGFIEASYEELDIETLIGSAEAHLTRCNDFVLDQLQDIVNVLRERFPSPKGEAAA